jgi:hypothetical protein
LRQTSKETAHDALTTALPDAVGFRSVHHYEKWPGERGKRQSKERNISRTVIGIDPDGFRGGATLLVQGYRQLKKKKEIEVMSALILDIELKSPALV